MENRKNWKSCYMSCKRRNHFFFDEYFELNLLGIKMYSLNSPFDYIAMRKVMSLCKTKFQTYIYVVGLLVMGSNPLPPKTTIKTTTNW